MNYVFQLETMGHWEWAVYVLLNIYSPIKNSKESLVDLIPKQNPFRPASENKFDSTRIVEHALKEILSRHAPDFVEQPEKRSFLTQVCGTNCLEAFSHHF